MFEVIVPLILCLILIGVAAWFYNEYRKSSGAPSLYVGTSTQSPSTTFAPYTTYKPYKGVTNEELKTHNDKNSCWVAYQGIVYDVTDWLKIHPGGMSSIETYCGTSDEFTQAFNNKHGTSKDNVLKAKGKTVGQMIY
jgi:cytochrome b involved in lipid metabolism